MATTQSALLQVVNPHPFNYTLLETDICRRRHNDTFVLVVVHSAPEHFERREFIRQTYGSGRLYGQLKMTVVFFMGVLPANATGAKRVQTMLQREQELYHDIVQEDFIDSYRNLTYKAIAWMRWTTAYCQSPPFVLKVDDDVLMNAFVLVRHLRHMHKNKYASNNTISCLRWDKVQVCRICVFLTSAHAGDSQQEI